MATHTGPEARREQSLRRLGTRQPACVVCGETDPRCMELHHIAQIRHHEDTAIVCRNCHRKLSDDQRDHVMDRHGQDQTLATVGHYLMGLADLFKLMAATLAQLGATLIRQAKSPARTERNGRQ